MKYEYSIKVNSLAETEQLASSISKLIEPSWRITLDGNLGAGKTTFIKFLLASLSFDINIINSPTFTIINEYKNSQFDVYHLDLYRLGSKEDFYRMEIPDLLKQPDPVFLIEWAKKIDDYDVFYPLLGVFIKIIDTSSRIFYFFSDEDFYKDFFTALIDKAL